MKLFPIFLVLMAGCSSQECDYLLSGACISIEYDTVRSTDIARTLVLTHDQVEDVFSVEYKPEILFFEYPTTIHFVDPLDIQDICGMDARACAMDSGYDFGVTSTYHMDLWVPVCDTWGQTGTELAHEYMHLIADAVLGWSDEASKEHWYPAWGKSDCNTVEGRVQRSLQDRECSPL